MTMNIGTRTVVPGRYPNLPYDRNIRRARLDSCPPACMPTPIVITVSHKEEKMAGNGAQTPGKEGVKRLWVVCAQTARALTGRSRSLARPGGKQSVHHGSEPGHLERPAPE